jgi:hypothetical protein
MFRGENVLERMRQSRKRNNNLSSVSFFSHFSNPEIVS